MLHAVSLAAATDAEPFSHYGPLGILVLIAIAFGAGTVVFSRLIDRLTGTHSEGQVKGMTYEAGVNPIGDVHRRFNVRFYIVAITFLVFDVEIVFLYPWATVFPSLSQESGLGLLFLGRMMFFILTSIIAFAYAWRKGVFRYD
jgi:NADH-quinone oxidoreductase subunit A